MSVGRNHRGAFDVCVEGDLPLLRAVRAYGPEVNLIARGGDINNLAIGRPRNTGDSVKGTFSNLLRAGFVLIRSRDPDLHVYSRLDCSDAACVCCYPETDFAVGVEVVGDLAGHATGVREMPDLRAIV